MCMGTPVQYEQTVRQRVTRPGRRLRRCARIQRHTASNQEQSVNWSRNDVLCKALVPCLEFALAVVLDG